MPESNPEKLRLLAQRTNRALCLFRYFGDRCSRLRMGLEFLDVSLRPFATHCFAVFLLLRNFQFVSSLFDGGRITNTLQGRDNSTKPNNPTITPPAKNLLRAVRIRGPSSCWTSRMTGFGTK